MAVPVAPEELDSPGQVERVGYVGGVAALGEQTRRGAVPALPRPGLAVEQRPVAGTDPDRDRLPVGQRAISVARDSRITVTLI